MKAFCRNMVALSFSPWRWLTPRAKFYKGLTLALATCLALAAVDAAFVLPILDGWVAVVSLAAAALIVASMAWRWHTDESFDLPRRWIAPVR